MPTPIQLLTDPVSLGLFAIYAALVMWEAFFPARSLPPVRGWRLRGLAAFMLYFFLSSYLPLFWSETLLRFQLADLSALPTWAGVLTGLFVYEAGAHFWHRSMHGSTVLWHGVHQMHHSAERLDTFGAFWFSPLDIVGWTALSSVCLTLIVGLSPQAATIVMYILTFLAIFQHAKIRTPRWLGYCIQRPESHSVRHQRGVHAYNYVDLPVYDILLGTFCNPARHAAEQGFWQGASAKIPQMLAFRDVSRGGSGSSGASQDVEVFMIRQTYHQNSPIDERFMRDRLAEALKVQDVDYADIRVEDLTNSWVNFRGPDLDTIGSARTVGGIVRALYKGGWGYATFNDLEHLEKRVREACQTAKLVGRDTTYWAEVEPVVDSIKAPQVKDFRQVPLAEKKALMEEYNKIILGYHPNIQTSSVRYADTFKTVWYATSEGSHIEEEKPDVNVIAIGIARRDDIVQTGFETGGAVNGYQGVEDFHAVSLRGVRKKLGSATCLTARITTER